MNFRALIIDSNPQTRSYLWEAVLAEPQFCNVFASKSLDEGRVMFETGLHCDVVLISSAQDPVLTKDFLTAIKATEGGKEIAYVSVVRASHQETEMLAASLVEGTDGLLLSPYSVNSVRQVAEVASRVKLGHEAKRREAGARMMLLQSIKLVDDYGKAVLLKKDSASPLAKFSKMLNKLNSVWSGESSGLTNIAVEVFLNAPAAQLSHYQGASTRIKKKLADK